MHTTNSLAVVVFAPLVGAAILGLLGRKMSERLVALIACASVLVSVVFAFYAFFGELWPLLHAAHGAPAAAGAHAETPRLVDHVFEWITVGSFRAPFSLTLDGLSGAYVLFVTFVAFLIHVFATGYMKGEGGYYRFFCYLNLFMFNMLLLVLADNMLLLFVGWEGVGLCSYLLIGFYFRQEWPNSAAKKAFVVNRIGDVAFAIAVALTFYLAGTINFAEVATWAAAQPREALTAGALFAGGLSTIALLMFIGATGKSAQIPLFVWLPDAMAGPTPVSALIHAATMVTAGVYLVARSSAIFVQAPSAMVVVAVVGALTALFAATIGLAQWDIKKVLAYSTVSQLGYMFLACGVGAFGAGVFHVITHAFFKALLFLGSGSVIIGMHHEQDMRRMGALRKFMPITHATMAVGWLAICGVPIFSGFFSKDEILYLTADADWMPANLNWVLWGIGVVTALMTAVYMTRLMVLTFWTPERWHGPHGDPKEIQHAEDAQDVGAHAGGHHGDHHDLDKDARHDHHADDHDAHHHGLAPGEKPHETPAVMWVPLVVLAVLAAVGGFLNVPHGFGGNAFLHEQVLHSAIASMPAQGAGEADHSLELILAVVSTLIAVAGIVIGLMVFRGRPLREMPRLFENKWYVDELYDAVLIRPIHALSRTVLWRAVDVNVIDFAVNGVGRVVSGSGAAMRGLQTGLVRGYVAVILVGAALVVAYFTLFDKLTR